MTKTNKILSYILITLILIVGVAAGKHSMTTEGKMESRKNVEYNSVKVFLEDDNIAFSNSAVVKDEKVYVPIDEFSKKIGVDIAFDKSNTIVIKKEDKNLFINTEDRTVITEKNESFFIDSIGKGKKILLPLDIIANHFGFSVSPLTENTIKIQKDLEKSKDIKDEVVAEDLYLQESPQVVEEKVAYITFDDGPNVNTPKILDVLKEKNVKATFFMLGSNIILNPEIAKRISDEDHALGLHSMTHNFKTLYANPYSFLDEMNRTNEALLEATGKKTLLLRAPYGSKPYMKQEFRDLAISWGYRIWDWDVDSRDSIKKNTTSEEVYNQVVSQVANRNESIILFHDKMHTLEALPRIIDYLTDNGFTIKKLDKKMIPMNFWKDIR